MQKLISTFFLFIFSLQAAAGVMVPASLPAGSVFDYAGTACPTGSLIIPTTAGNISRSTYAALFAAIGTTWGVGDGSTTFGRPYIPADQVSVQANANVGTTTAGQVLSHNHTENAHNHGITDPGHSHTSLRVGLSAGTDTAANPSAGWGGLWTGTTSSTTGITINNATPTINNTGGTANLAAGVRFLKCVKV